MKNENQIRNDAEDYYKKCCIYEEEYNLLFNKYKDKCVEFKMLQFKYDLMCKAYDELYKLLKVQNDRNIKKEC